MAENTLLINAIIYLGAAVIAVPLTKLLGFGSVLGYLIAGMAIGPWGLGLIDNVQDIIHFAEFGVVLLMFLIGLELRPRRLWELKRPILALGGGQMLLTTSLITVVALGVGINWREALIIALALSLSSTAIALQSLTEKNLMTTQAGGSAFSILLFQDIAVIPILALISLMSTSSQVADGNTWYAIVKVIAVIAAIIIGGHYLIRPIFRIIAKTRLREIFTAFSLLLVIGIAVMVASVGLSMAMGSFLAGVLLADSEFRHELEAEIEPFKGLLLGLFFIAVGMSVDIGLLMGKPLLVFFLVATLVSIKLGVLLLLAKFEKIKKGQHYLFSFLLCQGGEFAFVLFSVATAQGVLQSATTDLLVGVVALSMLTTPILLLIYDRIISRHYQRPDNMTEADVIELHDHPIIIVGFGRFGRVVGRLLHANGYPTTILDHDPDQISEARKYGYEVYYGDARRLDLLESAGAAEAEILVITLDDPQASLAVLRQVKKHFPHLKVIARAYGMGHAFELRKAGVDNYEREMLESGLALGESVLKKIGLGAYQAKQAIHTFREHDLQLFEMLYEVDEQEQHITIYREAREQLKQILEADEEKIRNGNSDGWK
jgi:glutathione-regulated potassium-efflux system ancillary protein KefC